MQDQDLLLSQSHRLNEEMEKVSLDQTVPRPKAGVQDEDGICKTTLFLMQNKDRLRMIKTKTGSFFLNLQTK